MVTDAAVAADAVNVMPTAAHTDSTESLLNIDVLPGSAAATVAAGGSAGSFAGHRGFITPPRDAGAFRAHVGRLPEPGPARNQEASASSAKALSALTALPPTGFILTLHIDRSTFKMQ
jgi:hypothetical protein